MIDLRALNLWRHRPQVTIVFLLSIMGFLAITTSSVYAAPATKSNPADSKQAADCNGDQDPTKITSGPNRGKWYCDDRSGGGGGLGGQQVADDSGAYKAGRTCGGREYDYYNPSIDIGCQGKGNPIADALFGFIRFLSAGVGLIIIGSIIMGGIQYTGSRGEPQATAMAINRIRSSVFALFLFIFAYAILNYLVPGAILK